jgi:hypothetical protein
MPAAEVVARAKAAGMTLNEKYVYNIRAQARAKAGKVGKRGRPKGSTNKVPAVRSSSGLEAQFVSLALDLGLSRAEGLLRNVRASVTRVALG